MKVLLDAGHGLGNRHAGVMDPGAEANETTEHTEVERLRSDVVGRINGQVNILLVPNVNKSLHDKGAFIVANFAAGDVLLSLHLNDAVPSATGAEILFDDQKPENEAEAKRVVSAYCTKTGLHNRGAKSDTTSHEGNVFILGQCPGRGYLLECGFISNLSDLTIVRANGAQAIAEVILEFFNT